MTSPTASADVEVTADREETYMALVESNGEAHGKVREYRAPAIFAR